MVGTVSNCACAVRLETAPTGERKCPFIFRIHYKYPNQKKNGKIKVNPNGKNPTDVWQFPKVTSGKNRASTERTSHPAQFPMAVIERIIKASSNSKELILDPFIGSGTTAEVALRLGRPTVGFELKEDYCRIAADRLDNFFQHRKVQEAQLELFGTSKGV